MHGIEKRRPLDLVSTGMDMESFLYQQMMGEVDAGFQQPPPIIYIIGPVW